MPDPRLHSSTTIAPIDWAWERAEYQPLWHESIFALMARYLADGAEHRRVLEVGAGGSHTLGALSVRLKYTAYGVEPDITGIATTVRLANQEGGRVHVVRGDGFRLPFRDKQFDVVYSLGVIEHFPMEQTQALAAEHARVCRDSGKVVISVPNQLNLPHTFHKAIVGKRYPYYPERSYTTWGLKRVLNSVGLRVVAFDGILPLWSIGMIRGGRCTAFLSRLGLYEKLNNIENARLRAFLGYMVFAIAEKCSP